jgi:hypothetical protein
MKHLFVTYELALLAKEKGFDDECLAYYSDEGEIYFKTSNSWNGITQQDCHATKVTAPLWQQLSDWFIKEKLVLNEDTIECVTRYLLPGGDNYYSSISKKGKYTIGFTNDYPLQHGHGSSLQFEEVVLKRIVIDYFSRQSALTEAFKLI